MKPIAALLLMGMADFCFCAALTPAKGLAAGGEETRHVNLKLSGDISGRGHSNTVEWYAAGPFPPVSRGNPPQYVLGVAVRRAGGRSRIIASWASPPTTIPTFYPKLNGLWPLPGGGGALISRAVQYGGRVLYLFMFRLEGNALREVGHWGGENISLMQVNGRLVVEVVPDDYSQVPTLYTWRSKEFTEASQEFPAFYAKLGTSYAGGVLNPNPLPVAAVVQACRLALRAYQLAKQPAMGRKACLNARQRITSGRGIIHSSVAQSQQNFEQERKTAVGLIDTILSK